MTNNVRDLLNQRVSAFADKAFLFSEADGRSWSYAEFDAAVNRTANMLLANGIGKHDVVSLLLPNSAEYIIAYFACWKIGALAGPVNSLLKGEEIEWVVGNSESKLMLVGSEFIEAIGAIDKPPVVIFDRVDEAARGFDECTDEVEIDAEDEAIIIYTSGTTGKPKGCLLTHRNLISNAEQIAGWMAFGEDDRLLTVMPLFHMNAVSVTTMTALYAGASTVVTPRFSATRFWDIIDRYKITSFGSVATMLSMLLAKHEETGAGHAVGPTLRYRPRFAMCGSAPVPAELLKRFEETFGFLVIEGYGLSESTCRSTFNPPNEKRRPGSCGMSIGNDMKVVDEEDNEVPDGELGEIVLRGPNICKAYFKNDEATRKAFANGWFHTGDIGYRDSDGFFYIADRKSDMIIRSGENIYPREIDDVLYAHPAVAAAAAIGIPDAVYGEEVTAFVVLKNGFIGSPPFNFKSSPPFTVGGPTGNTGTPSVPERGVDAAMPDGMVVNAEDLINHCREHLADFKCPKTIHFVNNIPKGPTGKLLKRELSQLAASSACHRFDTFTHFSQYDAMLNSMEHWMPSGIDTMVADEVERWSSDVTIARIWQKDAAVWTGDDESMWLDWLDVVGDELANVDNYRAFREDIESDGFTDVLLMGMGGSSLCPEVLALTFGKSNFHILDSTVPAQIRTVEESLDLEKTLFIVASKSGSTLEPNCFKQYFFERLADIEGRVQAGKQFVAITDPGSKMEQVAKEDGFRHIFYGNPKIGGRFSALSAFGMTAAASMGLNVEEFLKTTELMVDACRQDDPKLNPGALLGIIMGVCHKAGRDKLTISASPEIHDLGAWLEQLIAESTGKQGAAIIPIDRESVEPAADYSDDRVFVFLSLKGQTHFDVRMRGIEAAGHPVVHIELDSIDSLGQEFFRWEFATAVAGSIMQINPFNQPDVEAAKIEARKITDLYEETGSLPAESPFHEREGIALFSGDEYAARLAAASEGGGVEAIIQAHLATIGNGDYFGLLAYVEMNRENEELLDSIRSTVLERYRCATCLGFGPRFLHSTGQAYKGGANNGVFLQVTSDDEFDLAVPGQKYTFGVVKAAQARGDFQVLVDRGRRALRVHLGADVSAGLQQLASMIGR